MSCPEGGCWQCCETCNHHMHLCPGCGRNVTHVVGICLKCRNDPDYQISYVPRRKWVLRVADIPPPMLALLRDTPIVTTRCAMPVDSVGSRSNDR